MASANSWSRRTAGDPGAKLSGAVLFSLIWEALADLLGTAAVAVLMRRAARRGTSKSPELTELEVSFRELEYRCTVPLAWNEGAGETPPGLQTLIGELLPLLAEQTGRVAVLRLEHMSELRDRGLLGSSAEEKKS